VGHGRRGADLDDLPVPRLILPESGAVLARIARLLREDPKLELVIEGHTDSVGGAA
jgi:hypothetical protein